MTKENFLRFMSVVYDITQKPDDAQIISTIINEGVNNTPAAYSADKEISTGSAEKVHIEQKPVVNSKSELSTFKTGVSKGKRGGKKIPFPTEEIPVAPVAHTPAPATAPATTVVETPAPAPVAPVAPAPAHAAAPAPSAAASNDDIPDWLR
jgi:hypothetical protein